MSWWSAHLLYYSRFRDGIQDYYVVTEDIVLLQASDGAEAEARALKIGEERKMVSDTWVCDGRPADEVFLGFRKVIQCQNPTDIPGDGTELSYSEFMVKDRESLERLLAGQAVAVEYLD